MTLQYDRLRTQSWVNEDHERSIFRVSRQALVSEDIFKIERKEVFDKSWLYVGHESEIPNPGDYRRRDIASRPVIFVRGTDGRVRVLLNSCSHRGAFVCRRDQGNDRRFQCFYHGWTFDLEGKLINVPRAEAYPESFDRDERALQRPAQTAGYRGLWFINFDPDADSLEHYLADVRELIDLTLDSAEVVGGWEVIPGIADYDIKANWKLLVENSIDMYHFATVHLTYANYVASKRKDEKDRKASLPETRTSYGYTTSLGHGGFVHPSATRPIANESPDWSDAANAEIAGIRDTLIARFGKDRGEEMCKRSRHLLVYPNLMFQDSSTGFRIRQIWPNSANHMRVLQWEFRPREELAEITRHRMDSSRAFLGPGGLGTPDDVEALESCQQGYRATADEWSDVSRGMGRDQFSSDDEEQMRGFWRRWQAQISQESTGSDAL
jgi:p-cumate 2,3-dioxygenase subunit alpha